MKKLCWTTDLIVSHSKTHTYLSWWCNNCGSHFTLDWNLQFPYKFFNRTLIDCPYCKEESVVLKTIDRNTSGYDEVEEYLKHRFYNSDPDETCWVEMQEPIEIRYGYSPKDVVLLGE